MRGDTARADFESAAMRAFPTLRNERGIVLPIALGILAVLSVSAVAVVDYSGSNSRNSYRSKSAQNSFVLAEAGINNAMAVLSNPTNNALEPTLLPETTTDYEGGTVTWSGVLDQFAAVWTLTSTGVTRNASTGTAAVERTLTARVTVVPSNSQPYNQENWNYIMSTQVTGGECDMTLDQNVNVSTRVFVFGNLCLQNQAKMWTGPLIVRGKVTLFTSNNQIGSAASPLGEVHVDDGCKYRNNALHDPCLFGSGDAGGDNVWATLLTGNEQTIVAPNPNWDDWYVNGSPGPYFPCQGVREGFAAGTPPEFDNDELTGIQTFDAKKATRNNSITSSFNLTPSTASYSCKNNNGELTWDHVNRKLYVEGTIFVDGDVQGGFSSQTTISYEGTAAFYISGSLKLKNIKFCAGLNGTNCDYNAWNPNTEMLAFVVSGHNRQSEVASGTGIQFSNAHFQGALFGTYKISLDTSSQSDGPMVASEVMVGQNYVADDFPEITNVPAGMPGAPTVYAQPNSPTMFSG
jgi:Tfp pilus assembly protein PilX